MDLNECNINSLIIKLTEDYPTESDMIRLIKICIVELDEKKNLVKNVDILQQIVSYLKSISLNENLVELQSVINEYKYNYNIYDIKGKL